MNATGLRGLAGRLETTFVGRCVGRFAALQGIDRAVVIASQAFTALIPLLLIVAALAPAGRSDDAVSTALVTRFHLKGDAAHAVEQLFAHSATSSIGVFSGFLLLFSGLSLTRRMQRMYQQAWQLSPVAGLAPALHALLGLTALVVGIGLLYAARALTGSLALGTVLLVPVSVLLSSLVWISVPWLLLHRRVAWRRLVPTGVLTAACTAAYGVASIVYIPRLLETYSRRYGLFGVTLALVGWLLCIAVIVVAATAVAVELDRAPEPWARRVRRTLGIEPATGAPPPMESVLLPVPAAGPDGPPAPAPSSPVVVPSGQSRAARQQDGQARRVDGGSA